PLQVSGGKYIPWRALLDLLSQRRTCSIADDDFDTTLLCKSCINIIERVRKRGGGKHRDGFILSGCCSNREEPRALPNDHSKRNDAQNYKRASQVFGFCAFNLPLCCYPPQEQTHQWAKSFCVRPKTCRSCGSRLIWNANFSKNFDLAQLANGFGLLRLWMR